MAASRERGYSILADYREGHASILPPQFTSMVVEQGGVGAGTVIPHHAPVGKNTTLSHGRHRA